MQIINLRYYLDTVYFESAAFLVFCEVISVIFKIGDFIFPILLAPISFSLVSLSINRRFGVSIWHLFLLEGVFRDFFCIGDYLNILSVVICEC